jgi:hypothetical protein
MSENIELRLVRSWQELFAVLAVLVLIACRSSTIATQSTSTRSPNPAPSVAPVSSQPASVAQAHDPPTEASPTGSFWAIWIESDVASYANLEFDAQGVISGGPFGAWERLFEAIESPAVIGSLRTTMPCVGVQPPPVPATAETDDVRLLSLPSQCWSLELAGHPATKTRLQWYGWQSGARSVAVLRPQAPTDRPWLLVLADSHLSPAGPWLALTTADLDEDGLQDIAFVAQGVDGCDRGPCPLFWIDVLMSRTHTVLRGESSVLLTVQNFEQQTGVSWFDAPQLSWRGHASAGRYDVETTGAKRKLAWSARLQSNEVVVRSASARQGSPDSRRPHSQK